MGGRQNWSRSSRLNERILFSKSGRHSTVMGNKASHNTEGPSVESGYLEVAQRACESMNQSGTARG